VQKLILPLVAKSSAPPKVDGRRARSERTREAIVDVVLDLIEAGETQPSTERIAELAGVSRRVVFNHFQEREQLFITAVARQMARVQPTLPPLPTRGTLDERLDKFVAYRRGVLERVANVRRVAMRLELTSPAIAARLRAVRAQNIEEMKAVFAPEIAEAPAPLRDALIAALAAAGAFTFWDELTIHLGLSAAEAARVLRLTLRALVSFATESPPGAPAAKESL
jgi:AcrR family transcriptional regulator